MFLGEFWNQGETRARSLFIYPSEMFPTDVLSIDLILCVCVCVHVCVYEGVWMSVNVHVNM